MAIGDTNMISDNFWLNIGAEVVYKSLDNRVAAVERLQKTIVWIFGIYGSITIGSAVFTSKESWNHTALLLFGIAFLFLIVSYWLATAATFPQVQDFFGNAVDSIRETYMNTVIRSAKAFIYSVVLCSTGVLFYSIALFLQFGSPAFNRSTKEVASKVIKEPDSLEVQVISLAENTFALQIQSRKNSWVSYTVVSDTVINQKTKTENIPFSVQSTKMSIMWMHIDTTTRINQSIEVKVRPGRKYHLCVSRTDTMNKGAVLYTIRKKIPITP